MYLDHIRFQNFRTFRDVEIDLVHPQQNFAEIGIPKPHLPNLNLLLGRDQVPREYRFVKSKVGVQSKGDLEILGWREDEAPWQPIFQASSDAVF